MTRLRFPVSVLALGLGFVAGPFAQSAVAQDARIEDIQISQAANASGAISILVKLSGQPAAASVTRAGGVLTVDIDGVTLPLLAFDPAGNALVRHVAVTPSLGSTPGSHIRFEGAAFSDAATTVYRNAVLIEAKLAEASLPASASLMAAPPTVKARASATQPTAALAKPPPAATAEARTTEEKPPLVQAVTLTADKPAVPNIAPLQSRSPIALTSAARAAPPAAPTPPTPPVRAVVSMTGLAKLDANACAGAEAQLASDAWSLSALGNRALCLIDQQRFPEAKSRIDQLAAFSPEDWRVNLGRAALAEHEGDASRAEIGYRNAAQLAPDSDTRKAIKELLARQAGPGAS